MLPDADTTQTTEAAKAGARHSAADTALLKDSRQKLREIDANLVQLGTPDDEPPAPEADAAPEPNTLKAISFTDDELRVGNYIVLHGGKDLTGEHFTPRTELESDFTATGRLDVDWEHGQQKATDGLGANDVLGYVDWKTAKPDDKGVWVQRVLNRRNQYVKWLQPLIEAGLVGTSSQAVGSRVKKTTAGEITVWPLYRDALTVQPAEPRMMSENVVAAMKALGITAEPGQAALDSASADKSSEHSTGDFEMDPNELKALQDGFAAVVASNDALKKQNEELVTELRKPALKTGAVTDVRDLAAEKPFATFGEQLQSIKAAALNPQAIDPRLLAINEKHAKAVKATGASEGTGADGGFLVQQEFSNEYAARMYNTGEILSRVNRRGIGAGANGLVINTIDETSRADGSRFGGVQAYWTAEGGTKTGSRPKFRRFSLNLEKIAALFYATDELLQDAAALEGEVSDGFVKEIKFKVEDAIYNGDGVGKPLGWLNAVSTVSVAKEVGQAAGSVVNANILAMWSRLWAASRSNAVWYYNQLLEPQLWSMYQPAGVSALEPRFVNVTPDGKLTIFGRPAIPVEYAAAPGTVGDIVLADPREYRFIDKGGIKQDVSIHVAFVTDETAFRWVYRCNGAPFWNAALTPFKGSSTLSPIISLATRA